MTQIRLSPISLSPIATSTRLAVLSTYPPTECGIATFSRSLTNALAQEGSQVNVVRLMNEDVTPSPFEVVHEHWDGDTGEITGAVLNSHDAVIIQHEFGIFGGPDGQEIIDIMDNLCVPIIVVLHTVLTNPSVNQREVLNGIIERADALVTMTHAGKAKLIEIYAVAPDVITVIPHGAHPMAAPRAETAKVTDRRPRILTWGLLGPGKGIEWAIDALGELSDLDCSPEYVIAGQTHPHVKSHQGEKYREELYRRVAENNLQDDVVFVDAYLDSEHLETLISSADVVVLPYDSLEQVTSGVLVEALVAGKPVIATNFPHAREALADGSGILVDQRDSHAIANGLRTILGDDSQAAMMHEKSSKKANQFLWSSVSGEYVDIANALAAKKLSKKLVS